MRRAEAVTKTVGVTAQAVPFHDVDDAELRSAGQVRAPGPYTIKSKASDRNVRPTWAEVTKACCAMHVRAPAPTRAKLRSKKQVPRLRRMIREASHCAALGMTELFKRDIGTLRLPLRLCLGQERNARSLGCAGDDRVVEEASSHGGKPSPFKSPPLAKEARNGHPAIKTSSNSTTGKSSK
jgi:hypothetical protein